MVHAEVVTYYLLLHLKKTFIMYDVYVVAVIFEGINIIFMCCGFTESSRSRLVENSVNYSIKFTTTWIIAKWTDGSNVYATAAAAAAVVEANAVIHGLTSFSTISAPTETHVNAATSAENGIDSTATCTSPTTASASQCPTTDSAATFSPAVSAPAATPISKGFSIWFAEVCEPYGFTAGYTFVWWNYDWWKCKSGS